MANLLDSVENSIWHAFDYLALEGDGTATKLKLKVSDHIFDLFSKTDTQKFYLFFMEVSKIGL